MVNLQYYVNMEMFNVYTYMYMLFDYVNKSVGSK